MYQDIPPYPFSSASRWGNPAGHVHVNVNGTVLKRRDLFKPFMSKKRARVTGERSSVRVRARSPLSAVAFLAFPTLGQSADPFRGGIGKGSNYLITLVCSHHLSSFHSPVGMLESQP